MKLSFSLIIIYLFLAISPGYAEDTSQAKEGVPGRRVGGGTRVWDELLIDVYQNDRYDCRSHPSRCTA